MTGSSDIAVRFAGPLGGFRLNAAFTAPGRGVTAIFGPSGCGKTSVLRCIAGLRRLEGECLVGRDTWQDATRFLPPHRRPVGYVFQEASLFPHLSVLGNLLYSLRGVKPRDDDGRIGFDETVELLGLPRMLDRAPAHLSGGERQRVAIGRALLSQPRLLLMDEPLSALDRRTRGEILPFLERLHDTLAIPVIYVTHDMTEVERLADHIVLMEAGSVIAAGPLAGIQNDTDLPLAGTREASVVLEATSRDYDAQYGLVRLDVRGGSFIVPSGSPPQNGAKIRLRVGAGDVSIVREHPNATSILNVLPARIVSSKAVDEREMVLVLGLGDDGDGDRLLARVTRRSWDGLGLSDGLRIHAQVKSAALSAR